MRKAAIIGATGYGGAELVRILHQHPHVSIHSVHASTLHGEPLVKSFPHMQELINHRLETVNVEKNLSRSRYHFHSNTIGSRS